MKRRGQYIEALAKKYSWKKGAELGVWYGQTYFHLLDALPGLTLIGVDNWQQGLETANHHTNQKVNRQDVLKRRMNYNNRAVILEKSTSQAAELVPDRSLDFVFVDADHSYEGCKADLINWIPKLKPEGWIIGHDFLLPGVNRAVRELLEPVNCPIAETDETWARPLSIPVDATTVCCIKKGNKYGPEYVNRLYSMVQRHAFYEPWDFVCFTDDTTGIDPWVKTAPLPWDAPGWWGKMGLFRDEIPEIRTRHLLFLDLDVVITGRLDEILSWPSDFAMIRDWPEGQWPDSDRRAKDANSSVILLTVGSHPDIWEKYAEEGFPIAGGDQDFVNLHFKGAFDLFPDRLMKSYKLHHLENGVPADCRIVMFHGNPKQADIKTGWVPELWK